MDQPQLAAARHCLVRAVPDGGASMGGTVEADDHRGTHDGLLLDWMRSGCCASVA
jgi:hypothetical protein